MAKEKRYLLINFDRYADNTELIVLNKSEVFGYIIRSVFSPYNGGKAYTKYNLSRIQKLLTDDEDTLDRYYYHMDQTFMLIPFKPETDILSLITKEELEVLTANEERNEEKKKKDRQKERERNANKAAKKEEQELKQLERLRKKYPNA